MNKRAVGTAYERQAGAYLQTCGYEILEYNFRCRSGEIDIVARDGGYLVFVEVKYRSSRAAGDPLEAVHAKKQKIISRCASCYCMKHGLGEMTPCRFDVVAVLDGQMRLVKHAFEYCG